MRVVYFNIQHTKALLCLATAVLIIFLFHQWTEKVAELFQKQSVETDRSIMIKYDIHQHAQRESVDLHDSSFTYKLNLTMFEKEFPFLQRYRCTIKINREGFCKETISSPLFLLAIKSHPSSGNHRATLRRTWARHHHVLGYTVKPLFLLAMSNNEKDLYLVMDEDAEYGDIMLWDFLESHHNLSLKERCFLEWVYHKCNEVKFIFKGDDDEFVNPVALVKYTQETEKSSAGIHGNIQKHSVVMRFGKYKISTALYPLPKYPFFPSGGGFIIPGALIPNLYQASVRLPVYPLDDVFLGFLALAAGIPLLHNERFCVFGKSSDICSYEYAFVVHLKNFNELEKIWNVLHQWRS